MRMFARDKKIAKVDVGLEGALVRVDKGAEICIFREVIAERSFLEHDLSADERHVNRVVTIQQDKIGVLSGCNRAFFLLKA